MRVRRCFAIVSFLFAAGPAAALRTEKLGSYDAYLRGLVLEREGNLPAASFQYDKAIKQEPASPFLHRAAAQLALRMGSLDKAAEEIEKSIALDESDHDARVLAGEIYFTKGDWARSVGHLERALEIDPQSEDALLNLGYVVGLKDPRKGLEYYQRYLTLHPGAARVYERMAPLHQELGETREAEKLWRRVLEGSPGSLRANVSLGSLYEVKGDTRTAIEFFESARRINPEDVSLLQHVGQLYYKVRRSSEAFTVFQEAYAHAPDNLATNFWLALLNEDAQNWREAARYMDRVARSLSDPGVLLRLSYFYARDGRPKASLTVLKRLRKLDPSNPDFIYYEALGQEQAGHFRAAAGLLQEYLAIKPRDPNVHFQLGTILERLGRFDEAVPALRRAIELKPDYDVALNYLGYSWADRGLHLGEAEELVERALKVDPANPAYRDSLGWVYYRQGRMTEAERELAKALAASQDPLVREHWGDALWELGDKARALEAWQTALEEGSEAGRLRPKISKARPEVDLSSQARIALGRARSQWNEVGSFSGLATFKLGGEIFLMRIEYVRNGFLRVEPVAPEGSGGYLLLEQGRWTNALAVPSHAARDFQEAALRLESFFSGAVFRKLLDDSRLEAEIAKDRGVFSASGLTIRMELEGSRATSMEWNHPGGASGKARLRLRYGGKTRALFPDEIFFWSPGFQKEIRISLSGVRVKPAQAVP